MNKSALVGKIMAHLEAELVSYARSARAAHAEATDEQSKAENKYDTRGLEASYLAQGQSRQAAETEDARRQFDLLTVRDFSPGEPIDVGALVAIQTGGEKSWYFVGPRAGGTEIEVDGVTILVITLQSPLGQQLRGCSAGDTLSLRVGGRVEKSRIESVV